MSACALMGVPQIPVTTPSDSLDPHQSPAPTKQLVQQCIPDVQEDLWLGWWYTAKGESELVERSWSCGTEFEGWSAGRASNSDAMQGRFIKARPMNTSHIKLIHHLTFFLSLLKYALDVLGTQQGQIPKNYSFQRDLTDMHLFPVSTSPAPPLTPLQYTP